MMIYYIVTIIFIIVFGFTLYKWNKKAKHVINYPVSKWFKSIHYALLCLVVIDIAINSITGFHYKGLWTSRIFIIGLIITGFILYPLGNKSIFNKLESIYFKLFSYIPAGIGLFGLIPKLGVLVILSLGLHLFNPADKIIYNDANLRIQKSATGILGNPHIETVEKRLFVERVTKDKRMYDLSTYDTLFIDTDRDSIRIRLTTNEFWYFDVDTIFAEDLYFAI